jgi:GNAT superfamily N-acetyltransferase
LAELLDPTARGDDYAAVEDEAGSPIGFFHHKQPHGARLEIGLGLHPERTGQGFGKLPRGRARVRPPPLRSQAVHALPRQLHRRAITVYEGPASLNVRVFTHWTNGGEWEVIEMQRSALQGVSPSA